MARKNLLDTKILAHPEAKESMIAEINTLKSVVLSIDAEDYN